MNNIENKVNEFMSKNDMLNGVRKVYVATSGGADSMALLAYMNKMKINYDIDVEAVHVNHGIRGETARRDAEFVRNYCSKQNIKFTLFDAEKDNIEVPENASEEWARQLRYGYFNNLIKEGVKIATAHTLSDQLETVLFRMSRGGSGLNGMTGIPVKRDEFIRPFLCINRNEVEQLVELYGTGNITDETNLGDVYSRNKIRHTVVPVLKQINQNAEESVGKLCERLDKAQRYIEKQATKELENACVIDGYKYDIKGFIEADEIILDEMLIQLLRNINIQSEQIVDVLEKLIGKVIEGDTSEKIIGESQVSDEVSVVVSNKYITIKKTNDTESKNCILGDNTFGDFGYGVTIQTVDTLSFLEEAENKFNLCNFADADRLDIHCCTMRSRLAGDVFKPACKMSGKVTKLMRKIPLAERDSVPIIEMNGKIIWVWGVGFTDGFTPNSDSKRILRFTAVKNKI